MKSGDPCALDRFAMCQSVKVYLQPIIYGFANLTAGVFTDWSLMVDDTNPFFGMGPGDGSIQ